MRTSISRRLTIVIFIVLVIGIICGISFLILADESSKEIIYLNINNYLQNMGNNHINNIICHFIIVSSLIVLSCFIIGIPISFFILFYNGFSIGFIVTALTNIFGINGLLYGLLYVFISKMLFIVLLSILVVNLIKISKMLLDKIIRKINIKEKIYILLIRLLVITGLIILNDIVLYFGGIPLLNIFQFLII